MRTKSAGKACCCTHQMSFLRARRSSHSDKGPNRLEAPCRELFANLRMYATTRCRVRKSEKRARMVSTNDGSKGVGFTSRAIFLRSGRLESGIGSD